MKLYVGNLDFQTTTQDLEQLFSQAGQVASAIIITDKHTGKSKGFGFVEMEDNTQATSAVTTLNGKNLKGQSIIVSEARPPKERRPGSGKNFRNKSR